MKTINAREMREIRAKSAKHIFNQKKLCGQVAKDAVFDVATVDMADIKDDEKYYGGFTFVNSVAEQYAKKGLLTAFADASHMEGKG